MARERLSPEERERRKKERSRQQWARMKSGEAYNHFDPRDGVGYGSEAQWQAAAEDRINGGNGSPEAVKVARKVKIDADLVILGLTEMPTKEGLTRAYRLKSREVHPDIKGGSHTKFIAVRAAYDRLVARYGF